MSRQEIAENIFLTTTKVALGDTQDGAHTEYQYEVEVNEINQVTVELDFSSAENIKVENGEDGSMTASAVIMPYTSGLVATVRAYNVTWNTSCKIRMLKQAPPIDVQKDLMKDEIAELNAKVAKAHEDWKTTPAVLLTDEEISNLVTQFDEECFIDTQFPPQEKSIFDPEKGQAFDKVVHWRRPKDFLNEADDIKVFSGEIEPMDIQQGELGDCWFLCAVSSLAERPALVRRLFITQEYQENGLYRLRIAKNGQWQEVIVDDYIPCYPHGGPIFSRANGDELWVLLLEKAYAKIHGCYKALSGGIPVEAMMDLTGCPTTSFIFSEQRVQDLIESQKLWEFMLYFDQQGYLISAGTPGQDMWTENGGPDEEGGLVPGHAYSIIQVKEHEGIRLIQIRNPWGNFEWDGDWSDQSELWTPEMIQAFNFVDDPDDGCFWMSYEDFCAKFDSLDVCRVANWDDMRLRGKFQRCVMPDQADHTEICPSKWFYGLELESKSHVVFGLHQEDDRIIGVSDRRPYIDMGFALLRKNEQEQTELVEFKDFAMDRDVEMEAILEAGTYILVPRTTGCNIGRPNMADVDPVEFLNTNQDGLSEIFGCCVEEIFRRFDIVINESLDFNEFSQFLKAINQPDLIPNSDAYQEQILDGFASHENGLSLQGFKQWFLHQAQTQDKQVILDWLKLLDYDEQLYGLKMRLFIMTIHSRPLEGSQKIEVKVRDSTGTDIDATATELLVDKFGKTLLDRPNYSIKSLNSPGIYSWTYVICNKQGEGDKMIAELSFDGSSNLQYSTVVCKTTKDIQAGQTKFMMHCQAGIGKYKKKLFHKIM